MIEQLDLLDTVRRRDLYGLIVFVGTTRAECRTFLVENPAAPPWISKRPDLMPSVPACSGPFTIHRPSPHDPDRWVVTAEHHQAEPA